jgi:hypothetical protein
MAEALFQRVQALYLEEARQACRLLARKPDHQLLGKTEYELRDRCHRLGAATRETALDGREKGGTRGRARPARTAPTGRPGARGSGPGGWSAGSAR